MATPEEIRESWTSTNIRAVKEAEYQRDLAALSPREARRTDRSVRRADWQINHPRLPGFLARVFVH